MTKLQRYQLWVDNGFLEAEIFEGGDWYKADEADAHYGELIQTYSARHEVLLDELEKKCYEMYLDKELHRDLIIAEGCQQMADACGLNGDLHVDRYIAKLREGNGDD